MNPYKIKYKETGEYITNYTDHSDREGYNIGSYGLRPDGELIFFEATDGGMNEIICPELEVDFETPITNEDKK